MTDTRLTLSETKRRPLGEFAWPLTCRFTMSAPWGFTQQTLSFDIPSLEGHVLQTKAFAALAWSLAIAPAISRQVILELTEVLIYRASVNPFVVIGIGSHGQKFVRAHDREHAGQLVMMTGDGLKEERRRFFLPGIPEDWADNGLLTRNGWEGLVEHARAVYMGFSAIPPDSYARWLLHYPGSVPPEESNPYGIAFKEVTSIRVCHHTDRPPDMALGLWP